MEISGANRLSSDPATLETRRSKVRERNAAASPKFQWNTTAPADSRIAYRRNGYRKAEAGGLVIIGRAVGRKAERSKQE